MKNLLIALLLTASCMTACKNENPSELAQKRQELEAKRNELKEKQELAALEDELNKIDNFALNEIVTILSRAYVPETWYQVLRSNGQTGWVIGDYLIEL